MPSPAYHLPPRADNRIAVGWTLIGLSAFSSLAWAEVFSAFYAFPF